MEDANEAVKIIERIKPELEWIRGFAEGSGATDCRLILYTEYLEEGILKHNIQLNYRFSLLQAYCWGHGNYKLIEKIEKIQKKLQIENLLGE